MYILCIYNVFKISWCPLALASKEPNLDSAQQPISFNPLNQIKHGANHAHYNRSTSANPNVNADLFCQFLVSISSFA